MTFDARALDRARGRVVAGEERGIDHHRADDARQAKPDDRRVEVGMRAGRRVRVVAAAAGLPAVHPLAAIRVLSLDEDGLAGLEEVVLAREEVVRRVEDRAAEALRREIYEMQQGRDHVAHSFRLS